MSFGLICCFNSVHFSAQLMCNWPPLCIKHHEERMQFSCTERKCNKTLTCLLINPIGANIFWVNFTQTKKKSMYPYIHVYIYSAYIYIYIQFFFSLRITPEEFLETKIRSVFLWFLTEVIAEGKSFYLQSNAVLL